ncbi:MAG: hypothetical protein Tsb0010_07950 [Parvularculaceae bacterium]
MFFAARVFIAASFGVAVHLAFITILAGGQFGAGFEFIRELVIRYTIAAVFTLSISWRFPVFINGLIVGVLMAMHMAFVVLTFQGAWSFFQRALITNSVGGLGMAAGAALAVLLLGNDRD